MHSRTPARSFCRCLLVVWFVGGFGALPFVSWAQIGGRHVYDFLLLPASPMQSALGGVNISLRSADPTMGDANPGTLNESMHSRLAFSYLDFLADAGAGYTGYAHHIDGIGTFHAGLRFMNYGVFQRADEFGNRQGEYRASDMALQAGAARSFGDFHFGTTLKFIYSHIDGYTSTGMAVDMGGHYYLEEQDLGVGLVMRNFGTQFSNYTRGAGTEPLPFEIQAGVSKRIPHTPMRLSFTAIQLNRPNLIFDNRDIARETDLFGNVVDDQPGWVDNLFRHTVWGLEFLLSKNFHLRTGYNHLRRQELKARDQRFGFSGFAVGLTFRVKWFHLDYTYAGYHSVGGANQFMISAHLNSFGKNAPAPTEGGIE
jgi:hypothetical protein